MANASTAESGLLEISLTRRIAAAPEIVFQAWTDPKHLAQWLGPKGFTNPICEADARVGGAIRIHMHTPNGTLHRMTGRFVAIDRPHRLVIARTPIDMDGKALFEVKDTVLFNSNDCGTEISLLSQVVKITPEAQSFLSEMTQGWSQSMDRLSELLTPN